MTYYILFYNRSATYTDESNRIVVSVAEVLYIDPVDGAITDVTDAWVLNSCFTAMGQANSNCHFSDTGSASDTCYNAVVAVHYLILHAKDEYSSITQASARLIVTDMDFSGYGGGYSSQSFSISFFDEPITYDNAKIGTPANRWAFCS